MLVFKYICRLFWIFYLHNEFFVKNKFLLPSQYLRPSMFYSCLIGLPRMPCKIMNNFGGWQKLFVLLLISVGIAEYFTFKCEVCWRVFFFLKVPII